MAKEKSELEQYQEVQSQLNNVRAQRQQNFSSARASTMADNQNAAMIHQAGTVMAQAEASVSQGTQQTLSKYGVSKPKTVTQRTQKKVNNTTIINNNTTVNNYGGPIQGRALSFKSQSTPAGEANKFKAWLDNAFSRQTMENARRNKDYEKRERNLMRDSSKLMEKLSEIGKNISKGLDPRRIGATFQAQLKNIFVIFGISTIAANFTKIVNFVEEVSLTIKEFFGHAGEKRSKLSQSLVKLLGGQPEETVGKAFKNLFTDEETGIFKGVKLFFTTFLEERANAIKTLKAPKIKVWSDLGPGLQYISDVIAVALGGTRAAQKIAGRGYKSIEGTSESSKLDNKVDLSTKASKYGYRYSDDFNGWNHTGTNLGDLRILHGNKVSANSRDLTADGRLTNNKVAAVMQGKTLDTIINDTKTSQVHTMEALSGLQRLKEVSSRKKEGALVDDGFLKVLQQLGYADSVQEVKNKLGEEYGVQPETYKFITRKKEITDLNEKDARFAENVGRVTGGLAAGGAVILGATVVGATGGLAIPVVGALAAGAGSLGYATSGHLTDSLFTRGDTVEMVPMGEEVPEGSSEILDSNGNLQTATLYRIPSAAFTGIEHEVGFNFDNTNKQSIDALDSKLTKIKENNLNEKIKTSKGTEQKTYKSLKKGIYSDLEDSTYRESMETIQGLFDADEARQEALQSYWQGSRAHLAGENAAEMAVAAGNKTKVWAKGIGDRGLEFWNNHYGGKLTQELKDSDSYTPGTENISRYGKHVSLLKDDTLHFNGKGLDFARDMAQHGKYIAQSDKAYRDFSESNQKCSTGAFEVLGALLGKDFNLQDLNIAARNGWNKILSKWNTHAPLRGDVDGSNIINADTLTWLKSGEKYIPKVGDVAVWGPSCPSDYPGHMATYLGPFSDGKSGWVSDFRQSGCGVYSGRQADNDEAVLIYRLKNEIPGAEVESPEIDTPQEESLENSDKINESPISFEAVDEGEYLGPFLPETTRSSGYVSEDNPDFIGPVLKKTTTADGTESMLNPENIETQGNSYYDFTNGKYTISFGYKDYVNRAKVDISNFQADNTGKTINTQVAAAVKAVSEAVKESTEQEGEKKYNLETLESKQEATNELLSHLSQVSLSGAKTTIQLTESMSALSTAVIRATQDEFDDGRTEVDIREVEEKTRYVYSSEYLNSGGQAKGRIPNFMWNGGEFK